MTFSQTTLQEVWGNAGRVQGGGGQGWEQAGPGGGREGTRAEGGARIALALHRTKGCSWCAKGHVRFPWVAVGISATKA